MVEFITFSLWLVVGGACAIIAVSKGRSGFGWFVLGMLFSVVALIVVAVMPSLKPAAGAPTPETHKKCPFCAEQVLKAAIVCKHCGRKITQAEAEDPYKDGNALVGATRDGSWTKVLALLQQGADPNARDSEGRTALDVAKERGDEQIIDLLTTR